MPKASIKKLIECKKEQLIDLVLDIEKYPKFVPFCIDAKVYDKKEQNNSLLIIADLTIGKGPFKDTYKSYVRFNNKEDSIFVTNLDGPLKHLKNTWHFKQKKNNTEISFEVDFELKNELLNIVMTKSFQFALDRIAEAFQKRAENLFKNT